MLKKMIIACLIATILLSGCKNDKAISSKKSKYIEFYTSIGKVFGYMTLLSYDDGTYFCMPLVLSVEYHGREPRYRMAYNSKGSYVMMEYYGVKIEEDGALIFYDIKTNQYQVFIHRRWTPEMFFKEGKAIGHLEGFIEDVIAKRIKSKEKLEKKIEKLKEEFGDEG